METTKQKLVASIQQRLTEEVSNHHTIKFLNDIPAEDCVDTAIGIIYLYTRTGRGRQKITSMVEVISAIGHTLRNKYKMRRDSANAAKAGAFILYSFELLGIIEIAKGTAGNRHMTYTVDVTDDETLERLWDSLESNHTEKLPSLTPYAAWTSTRHETGAYMVKTSNRDVLKNITPETHPIVFDTLNKAQAIGWQINEDLYPIYSWALRNKTEAFAEIWEMHNPEAKQSKLREAKSIGSIAKRLIGNTFYHLYYLDFRFSAEVKPR